MVGRKRILVVDDDEKVLFVLRHTLLGLGDAYQIVTAASGRAALEKVRGTPFDLIITDLKMADVDGMELTRTIRALDPYVPVIWITGYGDGETDAEAARLSVRRWLAKPVKTADIRRAAREALEGGAAQGEAPVGPGGNSYPFG